MRSHRFALLGLVPLCTACAVAFTKGPPAGHEKMMSFTCTESNAAPILDAIWAGASIVAAVGAAADPNVGGEGNYYLAPEAVVALGLSWAAITGVSAISGFKKSKKCREARRALERRLADR